MDSLTQMALGASVGYAVAGKQMGNKALLWGAVGGTIPDLDVIGNLWLDEVEGLAFHRGFTHSLVFILLGPFIMTSLFRMYYRYRWGDYTLLRWFKIGLLIFAGIIGLGYSFAVGFVLLDIQGAIISIVIALSLLIYAGYHWRFWFQAPQHSFKGAQQSILMLYTFFFATFITHVFIDVCTTYGTQILYPFDLYRASFHNISVVDPLYTLPLLLGIIGIARWGRHSNAIGLSLSTVYMIFTFWNAAQVREAAHSAFRQKGVEVERLIATPTPMNTVLWNIVAEGEEAYYLMEYHSGSQRCGMIKTKRKQRPAVPIDLKQQGLDQLIWFSDGYYILLKDSEDAYVFQDLRFAFHTELDVETGFGFQIRQTEDDQWLVQQVRDQEGFTSLLTAFRQKVWSGLD